MQETPPPGGMWGLLSCCSRPSAITRVASFIEEAPGQRSENGEEVDEQLDKLLLRSGNNMSQPESSEVRTDPRLTTGATHRCSWSLKKLQSDDAAGEPMGTDAASAGQETQGKASLRLRRSVEFIVRAQTAVKLRHSIDGVPDDIRFRGVSVYHLSNDLMEHVRRAGLPRESRVYDIEELVIRAAGQTIKCPRDGKMGSAYCDAITTKDHIGRSNLMLSYTWGYAVQEIADTLERHCLETGSTPIRTYCWMCCLCVNQHRVSEQQANGETIPFHAFSKTFADRVKGIGHLVCMMTPWNDPHYLKRVWCNFEMYTALSTEDIEVSIVMPPAARAEFEGALLKGGGLAEVWSVLGKLSVQESQASISDDRRNIFRLISDGPGFDKLNVAVCAAMRKWLVDTCEADIRQHIELGDIPEAQLAKLFRALGSFVRKLGEIERALDLYELARKLREASGTTYTVEGAALMRSIGATRGVNGDVEGQMQAYKDAKDILEKSSNLGTNECAVLFDHMGDAAKHADNLDEALEYFRKANEIYEGTNQLESDDRAYLLKNMADVKTVQGDWNGASNDYEEAMRIRRLNKTMRTPDGALVLKGLGDVARRTYRFKEAQDLYTRARLIREKTGTMNHPAGAALMLELLILRGPDFMDLETMSQACSKKHHNDGEEASDSDD